MSDDEKKFQHFVDSVRFDDQPSAEHRDRLEEELLEAYDEQAAEPEHYQPEPTGIYLRKLAVAASFLIGCSVAFWVMETFWIGNPNLTYRPDPQVVQRIMELENPSEAERSNLMAQINAVWQMARQGDTQGLVTAVRSDVFADAVRQWAAEEIVKLGVEQQDLANPEEPLNQAAEDTRQQLEKE